MLRVIILRPINNYILAINDNLIQQRLTNTMEKRKGTNIVEETNKTILIEER